MLQRKPLTHEWLWKVPLNNGESLTSLLARQGRLCDMEIRPLLRAFGLPSLPSHGFDLDIAPPESLLEAVSLRLNISYSKLRASTLCDQLPGLLPSGLQSIHLGRAWRPSHSPWILPNAWQFPNGANVPRRSGIPFCPLCFADEDDPWYPVINRCSSTVVCTRHRVMLSDYCPRCSAPMTPMTLVHGGNWNASSGPPLCVACSTKPLHIGEGGRPWPAVQQAPPFLVQFQSLLNGALYGQKVEVPQVGRMSSRRFLTGLRYANTAAGHLMERGLEASLGIEQSFPQIPDLLFPPKRALSLEFLPLNDRIRRIKWFAWLFERPLDRWHLLLQVRGMSRVLPKGARHPWDGVGDDGSLAERRTWIGKSAHTRLLHPPAEVEQFFSILQDLDLTPDVARSLLGGISLGEYNAWRSRPSLRIPFHCRHRMEHFLRIWNGLITLFGSSDQAKRWLRVRNQHPMLEALPPIYFLARDPNGRRFEFISDLLGRQSFPATEGVNLPTRGTANHYSGNSIASQGFATPESLFRGEDLPN